MNLAHTSSKTTTALLIQGKCSCFHFFLCFKRSWINLAWPSREKSPLSWENSSLLGGSTVKLWAVGHERSEQKRRENINSSGSCHSAQFSTVSAFSSLTECWWYAMESIICAFMEQTACKQNKSFCKAICTGIKDKLKPFLTMHSSTSRAYF